MPSGGDLATDKVRAGRLAATGLALVAGFVDAYGYLGWHVFGANMTGNTIIFAISLYENAERAYLPLMLIALFLAGAIVGRDGHAKHRAQYICRRRGEHQFSECYYTKLGQAIADVSVRSAIISR